MVAVGVKGAPTIWKKQQGKDLTKIATLGVVAALKTGCTDLTSYEAEIIGALLWIKTIGAQALKKGHVLIDSESVLKTWLKIISPIAESTFDLTQRAVRKQRGSTYLQRLMRQMRRLSFGRTDHSEAEEDNALTQEVKTWPTCNAEGKRIHEVQHFRIDHSGLSWIKSHQTAALAGPVPIAFAANALADTVADEGAESARFKCINNTQKSKPVPGEVKVAVGGERIVALYRGKGIYGDAGEVLRALCADTLFEKLTSSKRRHEKDEGCRFRVMTRRYAPLGSPKEYNDVKVEGVSYDLTEDMLSTWTGQMHRLNDPGLDIDSSQFVAKCPLCSSKYDKNQYSTSHALIQCKHPQLLQSRTSLLMEVDDMLTSICPTITARRSSHNIHYGDPPALNAMNRPVEALTHAGNYLLDGDVDAWRGVPLTHLAAWLATSRVGKDKIDEDGVKRLLRNITAYIVVKGKHILKTYKELVIAQRQQEEENNVMEVDGD